MKERKNYKVFQTYVFRDNLDCFFVSTFYGREGYENKKMCYETYVWKCDPDSKENTELIVMYSDTPKLSHATEQHFELIKILQMKGTPKEIQ